MEFAKINKMMFPEKFANASRKEIMKKIDNYEINDHNLNKKGGRVIHRVISNFSTQIVLTSVNLDSYLLQQSKHFKSIILNTFCGQKNDVEEIIFEPSSDKGSNDK